ncbi:hypothetical protein EON66_06185 [archaeon]|nr:MAG: hypothetical protein EON66_06185 [archaeon]
MTACARSVPTQRRPFLHAAVVNLEFSALREDASPPTNHCCCRLPVTLELRCPTFSLSLSLSLSLTSTLSMWFLLAPREHGKEQRSLPRVCPPSLVYLTFTDACCAFTPRVPSRLPASFSLGAP